MATNINPAPPHRPGRPALGYPNNGCNAHAPPSYGNYSTATAAPTPRNHAAPGCNGCNPSTRHQGDEHHLVLFKISTIPNHRRIIDSDQRTDHPKPPRKCLRKSPLLPKCAVSGKFQPTFRLLPWPNRCNCATLIAPTGPVSTLIRHNCG